MSAAHIATGQPVDRGAGVITGFATPNQPPDLTVEGDSEGAPH
jgi:hypothetical protein